MESRYLAQLFFTGLIALGMSAQAQVNVFTEDFEGATLSVSSSSASGNNNNAWALSSNLQSNGNNSDTAQVALRDTLYLETNAFSTVGFSNVSLSFDQIAKIDFFDRAIIEYSTNNGSSWTQLTANEYTGMAFFGTNSFSSVSYTVWNPASPTASPVNSWWRTENFDISAAAGNNQVKVRWALIDADNNGAVNNYGWLIDDIVIVAAPCELVPPTIAQTGTIFQGQVYGTGPYRIDATITDASGVASADLEYTLNSGSTVTLSMNNTSGNNWQATIPAATVGDTICYSIIATDNTTCGNVSYLPSANSCIQFIVANNPPPTCVGTPVFNFNYLESFASFTPGNGSNSVGTLQNNWVNDNTDTHDWFVYDQSTPSGGTGPSADHSPGDANYMYIEASGSFSNKQAILNTPCYDFSGLTAPKFDFWYHMSGAAMGDLHLDIFFNGQWTLDVMPALIGDQGPNWNYRRVDLTPYAGNIVKLRFRGNTGTSFTSDIAIDDIEIIEPVQNDIGLTNVFSPSPTGCVGTANEFVTLEITNYGSALQDTIPMAYTVNGGSPIRDTAFITMLEGDTVNFTFQQTVNMATVGNYTFQFWIELPADQRTNNDSLLTYALNTSSVFGVFPDTNDFDNFTSGTPGTLQDGWNNDPSGDNHDWYVNTAGTPSNGTGPANDHTTGFGNYMYVEASTFNNQTANLFSKCLDISNLNQPELKFYYHMFGVSMGELHLDINVNGIEIQDIMPPVIGNQINNWVSRTVDLTPYRGTVKLIFRGITGGGFESDIAIDDVTLIDANPLGVESESREQEELLLYPNPAKEFVNVVYTSDQAANFQLISPIGQIVRQGRLSPNQSSQIDLAGLAKGVYQIRLVNEEQIVVEKVVIE